MTTSLRNIALLLTTVASSMISVARAEALAPPKKSTVVYQGTYEGEATKKSRGNSRSSEMSGALTIQVKFDGPAVTANIRSTGTMKSAVATGSRTGTNCKLYYKNGDILEGVCDQDGFRGVIRSQDGAKQNLAIEFVATTQKLVDEEERQRAAADARARREAEQEAAAEAKKSADQAERARQEEILRNLPPSQPKK